MKIRIALTLILLFSMIASLSICAEEKLGRGFVALEQPDGSVFFSCRKLINDRDDLKYNISRLDDPSSHGLVTVATGYAGCFLDRTADLGSSYRYNLFMEDSKEKGFYYFNSFSVLPVTITHGVSSKPYISIPLQGNYDFQRIGVGDLDGDGEYEYVINQPNFNTDPYQKPGYWKRSETTYKLEAYKLDGTLLWRYDMGWAIEEGIWYSPWIVYDVDGDGKAEVYCKAGEGDPRDEKGLVQSGPEWLVKLDGLTGQIVAKTDWLTRDGFSDYNYYCRNFLTVAYLDGKTPSLILQRGTYNLIKMKSLDKDFQPLWSWQAEKGNECEKYRGQSGHGLTTADVDGDGRDELIMGAAVIDDNGKGLWSLEMGHPDLFYCADIDPDNPGLEIFYGFETPQKSGGFCVVDAKSGRKLWTHKEPTKHLHGQGMCADILPGYPGMECYGGERDTPDRWLYSAKGQLIQKLPGGELDPRPLWWDGDDQKEIYMNGAIRKWGGEAIQPIEGEFVAVMDCLGDWREELIVSAKGEKSGEIRIYTSTIPTDVSRPCLMQDRQYRLGVCAQTMGYYYPAQVGLGKK